MRELIIFTIAILNLSFPSHVLAKKVSEIDSCSSIQCYPNTIYIVPSSIIDHIDSIDRVENGEGYLNLIKEMKQSLADAPILRNGTFRNDSLQLCYGFFRRGINSGRARRFSKDEAMRTLIKTEKKISKKRMNESRRFTLRNYVLHYLLGKSNSNLRYKWWEFPSFGECEEAIYQNIELSQEVISQEKKDLIHSFLRDYGDTDVTKLILYRSFKKGEIILSKQLSNYLEQLHEPFFLIVVFWTVT